MRISHQALVLSVALAVPGISGAQDFDDVVMTIHPVAGNVS